MSNPWSTKINVSTYDKKPDETQYDYIKRKTLERYYLKVKPEKEQMKNKSFSELTKMGMQPVVPRSGLKYWRKKYAADTQAMEILNDDTTTIAERLVRIKEYRDYLKILNSWP